MSEMRRVRRSHQSSRWAGNKQASQSVITYPVLDLAIHGEAQAPGEDQAVRVSGSWWQKVMSKWSRVEGMAVFAGGKAVSRQAEPEPRHATPHASLLPSFLPSFLPFLLPYLMGTTVTERTRAR